MRRLSFVLLNTLFVSWACSASENQSALTHDEARPVNEVSPFQWFASTREEFIAHSLSPNMSEGSEEVLPEDHPATLLAQSWLDAIDQRLRARFPKELRAAPRPKAVVLLSNSMNAFVSPLDECLKMPVRLGERSDSGTLISDWATEINAFILDRYSQQIATDTWGMGCLEVERTIEEKQALLDWTLSAFPGCQAQVMDEEIVLSGCERYVIGAEWISGASELRVPRTAAYVTFLSDLMTKVTEEQFVSVVAHELGHYYMSHVTSPSDRYGFHYFIQEHNHPHKPERDAEATALGEKVQRIVETELTVFHEVEEQEFHSEIFQVMKSMAWRLAEAQCEWNPECSRPCKAFEQVAYQDFGWFPFDELEPEKLPLLQSFEKELRACAAEIEVVSKDLTAAIGPTDAISWTELRTALEEVSPVYGELVANFSADEAVTLLAVLERMNAEVEGFRQRVKERKRDIYYEAAEKRLGWYTAEQEADDLSAEWMTLLGLDPHTIVEIEFMLTSEYESTVGVSLPPTWLSADECRALYERGWTDGKGRPVFVSPADFQDQHHSGCFRAFNVSREIKAHRYDHRRHKPARTDARRWQMVTKELKKLMEEKLIGQDGEVSETPHERRPGMCRIFDRH